MLTFKSSEVRGLGLGNGCFEGSTEIWGVDIHLMFGGSLFCSEDDSESYKYEGGICEGLCGEHHAVTCSAISAHSETLSLLL